MSELNLSGPILALVGIVLVLFRTKLADLAAAYYQRSGPGQERRLAWAGLMMGLVFLIMGYYGAYQGQPSSLLLIGGGALLALFSKEYARATVTWRASATAQRRAALLVGSASTGMGLLMTLYSALAAL